MLPKELKQIHPKQVHLCLKVKDFVLNNLKIDLYGKKLLLAVSGGVDSVVLLSIFYLLKKSLEFEIAVAHLNHGLREESKKEFLFVKDMCIKNNILFFGGSTNVGIFSKTKNVGIEEGARIIRYRFLQGVKKKISAHFIVTAHHLNDLAEDVILRMLRGSGWPELGGMTPLDKKRSILRPLLLIPKKDLILFAKMNNIKWYEDSSNFDLRFKRNRIRHEILPLLSKENPNFLKSIKSLFVLARIDEEYFDSILFELRSKEQRLENKIRVLREEFLNLPKAIRLRWLKDLVNRLQMGSCIYQNLLNLDKCIVNYTGPKKIQFPKGILVEVDKKYVFFIMGIKGP